MPVCGRTFGAGEKNLRWIKKRINANKTQDKNENVCIHTMGQKSFIESSEYAHPYMYGGC